MKKRPENNGIKRISTLIVAAAFACFELCDTSNAFGVIPAPDGGYAGGNTAEGQDALQSLTNGADNTAIGLFSLLSVTDANFNTGVGAGTLLSNTGNQNTATGAGALFPNGAAVVTQRFGLVAEEVEKVSPDLVFHDENGLVNTARYEQVNAMLLNEFLKDHRKVRKLEATVAEQQNDFQSKLAKQEKQIAALAADLQKVSAHLEISRPAPQMVLSNP